MPGVCRAELGLKLSRICLFSVIPVNQAMNVSRKRRLLELLLEVLVFKPVPFKIQTLQETFRK